MADLLQFLAKTPVQPRGKFVIDGVLTDLDGPAGGTCTVVITLPDGTAGPASGTVSHVSTGIYSFSLAGPADPTVYDIAWSGTVGTKPVTIDTQVEALGEFLFNLADLRGLRVGNGTPFAATAVPNFTDEQLLEARTATLEEFTRILGFSPVPRFRREVHDGDGCDMLALDEREATKLLAVTVDGAAQNLSGWTLQDSGILRTTSAFRPAGYIRDGIANVAVEYVAGWQRVEGDGSKIAMARAAMRLIPSIADAASSVTTADGTSISFDPAGQVTRAGQIRHFGVAEIDAWLNRWTQAGNP